MQNFPDILIIVACTGWLWVGADWLVEGAAGVAKKLRISELVIGLTIVSIGTSAPEFAVSVLSAVKGHSNISVANVVGSNIFNLGFILGGVALLRPIATSEALVKRDGSVLILTTLLLLVMFLDLRLSRWEGSFLIFLLVCYIIFLLCSESRINEDDKHAASFSWFMPVKMLVGLAAVLLCSHYLVDSSVSLARTFGISEWVIGVTIVALGTSIPELVTSLVAVYRGHFGLSAGNLVGSDIFNLLGVLGVAGALQSLSVSTEAYSSLILLSVMVVIVVVMMRTDWRLSRMEGGLLLCIGMTRWIMDFTG